MLLKVIPFKKTTREENVSYLFQKRRYIVFDTWNTSLNMVRGSRYGVESWSRVCCKYTRGQSKMKNCENNQTYGKISHAELNDTRGRSFGTKHFPLVVVTILRILFSSSSSFSIHVNLLHPCTSLFLYGLSRSLSCFSISVSKLPFLGFLQFKDNLGLYAAKVSQNIATKLLKRL